MSEERKQLEKAGCIDASAWARAFNSQQIDETTLWFAAAIAAAFARGQHSVSEQHGHQQRKHGNDGDQPL